MWLPSSLFMEVLEFVIAKYFLDWIFVCLQVYIYSMKTCSLEFMIHPWHVDVSHTTVLLAIFCKPNLLQGVLIASETPTEHTAITVYLGICFSVNIKLCLMSSLRWILARVHTVASLPVTVPLDIYTPTSGDTGCWSMNSCLKSSWLQSKFKIL